jgi:glycine hydroxymethyltransferase
MQRIADLIARVLIRREEPEAVKPDALALRRDFQTLYYCFETGLPPG